jgi:hypothetical protein
MAKGHLSAKKEYYSIREAAALLCISEPVLRLTIRCGKIATAKVPGKRGLQLNRAQLRPFLDPLADPATTAAAS